LASEGDVADDIGGPSLFVVWRRTRGQDELSYFEREYKFLYKCMALYHVSCLACGSLRLKRLNIQRIATKYQRAKMGRLMIFRFIALSFLRFLYVSTSLAECITLRLVLGRRGYWSAD